MILRHVFCVAFIALFQDPILSSIPTIQKFNTIMAMLNLHILIPVLAQWLTLLTSCQAARYNNGFFYHDLMNGNGNGESMH